jgi:hypothetical protein
VKFHCKPKILAIEWAKSAFERYALKGSSQSWNSPESIEQVEKE